MLFIFFLFWACLASFGKVVIDSENNPKHIILGRSKCDHCGHILGFWDLIPIVWRIINKWKCRYCSQNISIIYILLEIIIGLVFVMIYYYFGYQSWQIFLISFAMIMIIYGDIKQQTINFWFLGILVIIWLIDFGIYYQTSFIYHIYMVLAYSVGMIIVYWLSFLVNKIKYNIWIEGMWIGDIFLTIGLWINFDYLYQFVIQNTNLNTNMLSSILEGFWSQIIANIYIFLIWIVISSLYWLLIGIIYIYICVDNPKDKSYLAIPFWPALILGFISMLFV